MRGGAARAHPALFSGGLASSALPAALRWVLDQTSRLRAVVQGVHDPQPPAEYEDAHGYLVERGRRLPDAVDVSMELLEEMADARQDPYSLLLNLSLSRVP